jgi:peptidoglycan-associated lipoprotein
MKKHVLLVSAACGILSLIATGCGKKKGVWDDSNAAGSLKYKNTQSLWGSDGQEMGDDELAGPSQEDFIPLRDEDLKAQFADGAIPQSKYGPGESGIPNIDQFRSPSSELASLFRNLYFNTDEYMLKSKDALATADRIASYLKDHPNTYVVIEGHCDERGPEAYNLSLGARRANTLRSLLVKKGADLNQIHTISYGKERPADMGHGPDSWSKNRRAEFKIYQR